MSQKIAEERARNFVLRYPNMFKEDKEWWIAALAIEILEAEKSQVEADRLMFFKAMDETK